MFVYFIMASMRENSILSSVKAREHRARTTLFVTIFRLSREIYIISLRYCIPCREKRWTKGRTGENYFANGSIFIRRLKRTVMVVFVPGNSSYISRRCPPPLPSPFPSREHESTYWAKSSVIVREFQFRVHGEVASEKSSTLRSVSNSYRGPRLLSIVQLLLLK